MDSENKNSSYRSIFKATSIFGGVQVYNILIGIIKQKFVAVLLGPIGMGIQGLYTSALDMVKGFSSMGLSQSAVRDIGEANGTGNTYEIGRTVAVLRRLVWVTGILGMVATIVLSPILSKTSFGDYSYVIPFVILSITLLIDQISAGQKVVLQGMRKIKYLAKASTIGATVGLLIGVPLFYLFGINGIVPALIIYSATALLLSWLYSRKVSIEKVHITNQETFLQGKVMLKLGVAMTVSNMLVMVASYVLRAYIRFEGGVAEVGFYTAGFTIMNYYVGMVFSAISTDYYPRLSSVNKDNEKCATVINQQGEITVLILAPLVISCIILMPFIVRLIYSEEFLPASNFILYAILGMMFKAISWSIAFVFLAKAESKLFVVNEALYNMYGLVFNLLGYWWMGLDGLGISFILMHFVYMCQVYIIAKKKYCYNFSKSFLNLYRLQLLFVVVAFLLIHIWKSVYVYFPITLIFFICLFYSFHELDKRIEIVSIIKTKIRNK